MLGSLVKKKKLIGKKSSVGWSCIFERMCKSVISMPSSLHELRAVLILHSYEVVAFFPFYPKPYYVLHMSYIHFRCCFKTVL